MSDEDIIEVVQAHKDGHSIQERYIGIGLWHVTSEPKWDFRLREYRKAQEPRCWWAEITHDGRAGQLFTDGRQVTIGGELVRVREVIE